MLERELACFAAHGSAALPIIGVRPGDLVDAYATACGFTGARGQLTLLPGGTGVAGALLGLGDDPADPHVFAGLPGSLPPGTWHVAGGIADPVAATLGWGLGAYRQRAPRPRQPAGQPLLVLPAGSDAVVSTLRATWLARDLINTPANLLGPAELAACAAESLRRRGAHADVIAGEPVAEFFPALHAVGAGSARPPCVLDARWSGPDASADAPLISLCGKGVCFDSGGYDVKPSAGMLRMKKDMGGAAIALALACMIVDAALPVRLRLQLGCAENMISGRAMRPGDLLRTRAGLAVEVGNTDAEGRLVLCDLLAAAVRTSQTCCWTSPR